MSIDPIVDFHMTELRGRQVIDPIVDFHMTELRGRQVVEQLTHLELRVAARAETDNRRRRRNLRGVHA